ncbi:hypothetical protein BLNAU_25213 [Blattamonas nauphoetae]|uniref:Uncharacterized protein n=1 Tax=Blattamonas nauphoetae TaxID=2049346 RepID=A0ABQ9WK82_9EUKA|nr:hypothetical protein BLNAU_25213 [Blattamonas nauphoetae]
MGEDKDSQGGQNAHRLQKHTTCPAPTSSKRICSSWTRQSDSSVTRLRMFSTAPSPIAKSAQVIRMRSTAEDIYKDDVQPC